MAWGTFITCLHWNFNSMLKLNDVTISRLSKNNTCKYCVSHNSQNNILYSLGKRLIKAGVDYSQGEIFEHINRQITNNFLFLHSACSVCLRVCVCVCVCVCACVCVCVRACVRTCVCV